MCLYVQASPLPSFPSLVIFYTTSDRKLGGDGSLGTRLCSNYEVILHILYIHEHGPQAPVLEHELSIHQAQFAGSSLRTCIYMHRCIVNLASSHALPTLSLYWNGPGNEAMDIINMGDGCLGLYSYQL